MLKNVPMTEKTKSAPKVGQSIGAGRQKRFTDAFKAEPVRLVKTSGRPLRLWLRIWAWVYPRLGSGLVASGRLICFQALTPT